MEARVEKHWFNAKPIFLANLMVNFNKTIKYQADVIGLSLHDPRVLSITLDVGYEAPEESTFFKMTIFLNLLVCTFSNLA